MVTSTESNQLLDLPQRIYEARLQALEAEQHRLAAENQFHDLKNEHYLAASANGQGHFQALASASRENAVVGARQQRDQLELEAKRALANHQRLRDELAARLRLVSLASVEENVEEE